MGSVEMANNPYPSWVEIGPNKYRQPYGFQEVLYNAISVPAGSPGLFLVGAAVTFRHKPSSPDKALSPLDLVPLLRRAWMQMRQQYPTLAAENTPDGKVYISPSSREELEAWVDATFIVVPDKTWPDIWRTMIKSRSMTMYFCPSSLQLLVQGEHHIIDGRGGMNFWDRFFRALASPAPSALVTQTRGAEVVRLPPRSDDLLDTAEKTPGRGVQRAMEMLAPLAALDKPIALPMPPALPPSSPHNSTSELKADIPTTDAIKAGCKAHRISVTAAWHAAVVLATQAVQARAAGGTPSGSQFACFGNFDLRRYFPDPKTVLPPQAVPDAYNLTNHHSILPYVVSPDGKTFPDIARELDVFYQRDLPRADPDVWSALGPMIRMLVPEYSAYATAPEKAGSTPALSSFGVADRFIAAEYGEWGVEEVWWGNTVTGPWLECFTWTWKGRICFNSCYNPAYYTEGDVQGFHAEVLKTMLKGLGVDEGSVSGVSGAVVPTTNGLSSAAAHTNGTIATTATKAPIPTPDSSSLVPAAPATTTSSTSTTTTTTTSPTTTKTTTVETVTSVTTTTTTTTTKTTTTLTPPHTPTLAPTPIQNSIPDSPPKQQPTLQRLPSTTPPSEILAALRTSGAVIIKSLFTKSQIASLNAEVNPHISKTCPGSKQTDDWLRDFHGDKTKRLNGVVGLSPTFRNEILEQPLIHSLCEAIYLPTAGGYWLNSAQVIDIHPGSKAQPLHRDQWQFPIFTHCGPDAPEASVNFVVALSEFKGENGATRVIPGSHLWSDLSENGTQEMTIPAEMEVGDACFISGKVVHGGGANVTSDEVRRAITLVFQCSYLTPEEAYPFLVEKEVVKGMSPRAQRMIGFRSQFLKDSPGVWKRDYGAVDEVYC